VGRFIQYLNELSSRWGRGITFVDIDNTLFKTFASIFVLKNGKVVKKFSNQEYNTYKLQPGESFNFDEFRDASMFHDTSEPILPTINRIKRMFKNIDYRESKVVLLTARTRFKDMKKFKDTFKKVGLPIDKIDVEFSPEGVDNVSAQKKKTIMGYLETGEYRRVRLIDDDITNIKKFLSIKDTVPQDVLDKVREKHKIPDGENFPIISFYGLLVLPDGRVKEIK